MNRWTFIVISVLFLSQGKAFAEGGRMGPTLKTVLVPGSFDRGIKPSEAQKVVETCLITGDPSHGVTSLASLFYEILNGSKASFFPRGTLSSNEETFSKDIKVFDLLYNGNIYSSTGAPAPGWSPVTLQDYVSGWGMPGSDRTLPVEKTTRIQIFKSGEGMITLETRTFPRVVLEQIVPNIIYDELGRVKVDKTTYYRPSAIYEVDASGKPAPATFVNNSTQAGKIVVPVADYVSCLIGEFHNLVNNGK